MSNKGKILRTCLFLFALFSTYIGGLNILHEVGHVFFAYLSGGSGYMVNPYLSQLETYGSFNYYVAIMGGVWFESLVCLIFWRVTREKIASGYFAGAAIMVVLRILLWNDTFQAYGIRDTESVNGYIMSMILWWFTWFYILNRKAISQRIYNTGKSSRTAVR